MKTLSVVVKCFCSLIEMVDGDNSESVFLYWLHLWYSPLRTFSLGSHDEHLLAFLCSDLHLDLDHSILDRDLRSMSMLF